jgi:hypothetical protein
MKLSYIVDEIESRLDQIGGCSAFLIRENPDKKDDFLEIPIKEIVLDEDGHEINILTKESYSENISTDSSINVRQLYDKLLEFMPDAANYDLFASHPSIELEDDYSARLDVPIVAYGLNESETRFGLLEEISDST